MSKYILERDKFKPENVKFLIIAESPPASGGYFYFDKTTGKDSLFRETMKSLELFPETERMRKGIDKKNMLSKFQAKGFFVIDVCYEPVNNLKPKERRLAIIREIPRLLSDIQRLEPEKIVIVKSSIFAPVKEALEKANLSTKVLHKKPIPFPSCGNQKKYRQKLREATHSGKSSVLSVTK